VKYIILSILVLFSLSAYSQIEDTPLFVGKYFGNQSGGGSGYWQVTGTFTDESSFYDATAITVGDVLFFVDSGIGYHLPVTTIVSASGSSFTIRVNNTGITGVSAVPNGAGAIYRANSPKGIWPYTAGLTAADQQTLNSFLIKRLNQESVKRDTSISFFGDYNLGAAIPLDVIARRYNKIELSGTGPGNKVTLTLPDADPSIFNLEVLVVAADDTIQVQSPVGDQIRAQFRKVHPVKINEYRCLKIGAGIIWKGSVWDSLGVGGGGIGGTSGARTKNKTLDSLSYVFVDVETVGTNVNSIIAGNVSLEGFRHDARTGAFLLKNVGGLPTGSKLTYTYNEAIPVQDSGMVGTLYSENLWEEIPTSQWFQSGYSVTSARKITTTATFDGTLTNYMSFLEETTDENKEFSIQFRPSASASSSTRGMSIYINKLHLIFDMRDTSLRGKIYNDILYFGGTQLAQTTQISYSSGDLLRLTYRQVKNVISIIVKNVTTGTSAQVSITNNLAAVKNFFLPPTSRFVINNVGGTYVIDSIGYSSRSVQKPYYLFVGDSKTQGYSVGSASARISELVAATMGKTTGTFGGDGDCAAQVLLNVEYLKGRVSAKYALLCFGRNDVGFCNTGADSTVWQAEYTEVIRQIRSMGITPVHILPIPEVSLNQSILKNWINRTYPSDHRIDPSVGFNTGTMVSADNIHPNATGASFVAGIISTYLTANNLNQ